MRFASGVVPFAIIGVAALGVVNCRKKESSKAPLPVTSSVRIQTERAAPAPSAQSSALPSVTLRTVAEAKVPRRTTFIGAFTLERFEPDTDKTLFDAYAHCVEHGRTLCTESQWLSACAADATIGSARSWTATAAGEEGIVIRGGRGCSALAVSPPGKRDPQRMALCCERAIAVATPNGDVALAKSVATKLLAFETAMNRHAATDALPLLDAQVSLFEGKKTKQAVRDSLARTFRKAPDLWVVTDACRVTRQEHPEDPKQTTLTADCDQISRRTNTLGAFTTRYVLGGPHELVRTITEIRVARMFTPP